jgi:hypothetical protein
MIDYDFKVLNDKEFEILVTDLLSKRDSVAYERFKPGRDAGVDGRFFNADNTETIVQCKHRPASPLERVTKHLKDEELPKLLKLNPSRYIVALSHQLSRNDKACIQTILSPYILSPADILGREDLNDLLAENKQIELRHFKLWITSTNVLQYFLHKPIIDRSAFTLREAQENVHLYVPTSNHDRSLEKLEQLGTVIITGPAGIGKTTLADNLSLYYVSKGFSFIQIAEEIREAETLFQADENQLFYFDDFLGRNYLEALSGHEGTHIINFIKRINRDKKKRFILTSRTTILNQGKVLIDTFHNNNIEKNEFEVSFESFSEIDKARILYSHIWHSSLEDNYIDELYKDKRYRKIISHRNFNPRLIRYVTDSDRLSNCTASRYWSYSMELLDNPTKVWENPFEAQIDDFGRALVLLVTLNGRAMSQDDLAEAYSRFLANSDLHAMHGKRDFLQTLRHLSGSMLTRIVSGESRPLLNLFNPSIGDFVLYRYASDLPTLRAGFSSLRSTSSLRTLENLFNNELVCENTKKTILRTILLVAKETGYLSYEPDYIALILVYLAEEVDDLSTDDDLVVFATHFLVEAGCPRSFSEAAEVLRWAHQHGFASEKQVRTFISTACSASPTMEELNKLVQLNRSLPDELSIDLWPILETSTISYFTESIYEEFPESDVFYSLDYDDIYRAESKLALMIETKLIDIGIPVSNSAVSRIAEAFDIEDRRHHYFVENDGYDYREGSIFANPESDAIDDLFERAM